MLHCFVFDIETIPDILTARRLYSLSDLNDDEVQAFLRHQRRQETGGQHDFLRLYLHRIVAISVVLRTSDRLTVWSLGSLESDEADLLQRFFHGIERYRPTLISWNGSAFDLPVIHYRSLVHSITAPLYWETGHHESEFRWNNYLNRYHERHLDLMDVLAAYQAKAYAPLDDIATLLGAPGKMGMHGSAVWSHFQAGNLQGIRDYCETDVLNTYLVYLRFELTRGKLTKEHYEQECERLRDYLKAEKKPHFDTFLKLWTNAETVHA